MLGLIDAESDSLGLILGLSEGLILRLRLGEILGDNDGLIDGDILGLKLGDTDGL